MNLKTWMMGALLASGAMGAQAQEPPNLKHWKDDFSDEAALKKEWSAYGWLADGKNVSGPENMHHWWELDQGALRARAIPNVHPSGITHPVSGDDVRMSCRFKLQPGAWASVGFNGPNPILEANFHLAGVHIYADKIIAWDETNLYPKGSPEAEALKKEGKMNRKFIGQAKVEKIALAPDVWHDLGIEMHGREIKASIDGKVVLVYVTNAGDAPKKTLQFSVGGNNKEDRFGWYDDVSFEALEK